MKLRLQCDRRASEFGSILTQRESTEMQTDLSSQDGTGLSPTLQPELLGRTPASGISNVVENADVRVSVNRPLTGEEGNAGTASHRLRAAGHSHSHFHSRGRRHTHSEPQTDHSHTDLETGESSSSFSELRYLFCWMQKSLPFMIIVSAKLIIQHALGLAVGIGLSTTFLYVNKSIQTQVFLQDRRSKLQCFWLLSFLMASSLLLYYTFQMESLYFCLILMNPHIEPVDFWHVLWVVVITSFIVKFLVMGFKCLVLLLPSPVMLYRRRGQWYMFIEELGQIYQIIAPVPPWFHYLLSSKEVDGTMEFTLGILLALVYLIMKLLELYSHWGSLQKTIRTFLSNEVNGAPATQSQCSEAGEFCGICHKEFKQARVLLCQHIFCEECIVLWFNQERTCPLCRTIINDKVHKWKDGSTSPYLQIY